MSAADRWFCWPCNVSWHGDIGLCWCCNTQGTLLTWVSQYLTNAGDERNVLTVDRPEWVTGD